MVHWGVRRISRFIDFKSELKEQILFGVALYLTLCWKQGTDEWPALCLLSLGTRRLYWSGSACLRLLQSQRKRRAFQKLLRLLTDGLHEYSFALLHDCIPTAGVK
jgi:hypothetical protein